MNTILDRLNSMNYHIQCEVTGDFWYVCCGLRSLYRYSKISDMSFKKICMELYTNRQVTINDMRDPDEYSPERGQLTLTMI